MKASPQSRVSPALLSSALIALSALWFISADVFYLTNRASKDGVFGAPVWALFFLTFIPLSTFILAPWLLRVRSTESQQLKTLDYCGLAAGAAPFIFVGFLFLKFFVTR